MYQFEAEGRVALEEPDLLLEQMLARIRDLCDAIDRSEPDVSLHFETGEAIIRPVGDGLLFRVVANDPVVFQGIVTALEGGPFFGVPQVPGSREMDWSRTNASCIGWREYQKPAWCR